MQYNFTIALDHVQVIRSFSKNFQNNKHAILETLNLKTLLYWVASLKTLLKEKRVPL